MTDKIKKEPDELIPAQNSERRRRFRAALFWTGIITALLVFYFFGAPVPIILAEKNGWIIDDSALHFFLTILFIPVRWLSENFPLYQSYIGWLGDSL